MKFRSLLAAALWLLAPAEALADYRSEYKAYMAAFEAGDLAKALDHGEKAWREAEAELGDNATTAILAYNFARLAAATAPEKALEPLARAITITRSGVGALLLDDLLLRAAELRLRIAMDDTTRMKALGDLLAAAAADDTRTGEARAIGWRTLAAAQLAKEKFDDAADAADRAAEAASRLEPSDAVLLRETLLIAGMARIARPIRKEEHMAEAVALLDKALTLYPPQKDIEHFDPMLARTILWRRSVMALAASYDSVPVIRTGSRLPTGEDLKAAYERAVGRDELDDWVRWEVPPPEFCPEEDIWLKQHPPRYPPPARRKSKIGATVVGYDLSETGVERERILADFSDAGFGEAVLFSMKDWRLRAPLDPACRRNNILVVVFILK